MLFRFILFANGLQYQILRPPAVSPDTDLSGNLAVATTLSVKSVSCDTAYAPHIMWLAYGDFKHQTPKKTATDYPSECGIFDTLLMARVNLFLDKI
jgi:hypothetical protein